MGDHPLPGCPAKMPSTLSYLSGAPYAGTAIAALVADTDAPRACSWRFSGATAPTPRCVASSDHDAGSGRRSTTARCPRSAPSPPRRPHRRRLARRRGVGRPAPWPLRWPLDGIDTQVDTIGGTTSRRWRVRRRFALSRARASSASPGEDSLLSLTSDELRLRGMVLSVTRAHHRTALRPLRSDRDHRGRHRRTDVVDAEVEMVPVRGDRRRDAGAAEASGGRCDVGIRARRGRNDRCGALRTRPVVPRPVDLCAAG